MVLTGAVLCLLEWVAIIGAGVSTPLGADATPHDLAIGYAGHADALGWAAGWFCVVLLGRVLLMAGLRSALHRPGHADGLMDVAVVAMAVSVALEVLVYGVVAAAGWSLAHGGSLTTVGSLDAVAFEVNRTLYGPMGVSVLCAGLAMWRSGSFGRVLSALALVVGAAFSILGLAFGAPRFAGAADALSAAALPWWVWMIRTGVVVWRADRFRAGSDADVARPVGSGDSTEDLALA
jgi:hypothetical protein